MTGGRPSAGSVRLDGDSHLCCAAQEGAPDAGTSVPGAVARTRTVRRPSTLAACDSFRRRGDRDMAVQLNHTIVHARDAEKTAAFLVEILGLGAPGRFGPFHVVEMSNGVSLDVMEATGEVGPQHYAFLISEAEFDAVFGRIQ